jgi:hypothetical protein
MLSALGVIRHSHHAEPQRAPRVACRARSKSVSTRRQHAHCDAAFPLNPKADRLIQQAARVVTRIGLVFCPFRLRHDPALATPAAPRRPPEVLEAPRRLAGTPALRRSPLRADRLTATERSVDKWHYVVCRRGCHATYQTASSVSGHARARPCMPRHSRRSTDPPDLRRRVAQQPDRPIRRTGRTAPLGFQPVQKKPTIQVSSTFIGGIRAHWCRG